MLAMFGFVSMAIIGDDHFTTGFQSPVDGKVYISGHILSSLSQNRSIDDGSILTCPCFILGPKVAKI
jgi:hypothetical protein